MMLPLVPLEPLERGQLHVMRIHALLLWAVLLAAAGVGEWVAREQGWRPWLLIGPAALVAGWSILIAVGRRWARWGYAFTGRELHVARGWWVKIHTIVPVARVQHIDVSQGPFERMFGVATLELHTAGTDDSSVSLPGVTRARAEEIRDAIRTHILSNPW